MLDYIVKMTRNIDLKSLLCPEDFVTKITHLELQPYLEPRTATSFTSTASCSETTTGTFCGVIQAAQLNCIKLLNFGRFQKTSVISYFSQITKESW